MEFKQKLELLNDKIDNHLDSEDSEREQKFQKGEIAEKVDGLYQFQDSLPLAQTKHGDFTQSVRDLRSKISKEVLKQIKNYFR